MKTLFESLQMMGGVFLFIQILIAVIILILSIQKLIVYFGTDGFESQGFLKSHHAVLFIGMIAFVWGIFIQVVGFIQALNAIIEAADVSPALLWMGLKNSFISPLIGLSTLLLSAVLWGILHSRYTAVQPR